MKKITQLISKLKQFYNFKRLNDFNIFVEIIFGDLSVILALKQTPSNFYISNNFSQKERLTKL